MDPALITLGNAVTAETPHGSVPGIVVGVEPDGYRVLVAYPGENGHVAAVTLQADDLS